MYLGTSCYVFEITLEVNLINLAQFNEAFLRES